MIQTIEAFLPSLLQEAGEIILSAHSQADAENVITKDGYANFVTVFDIRVQEFLIQRIREQIPSAQFIAEEQDNDSDVLQSDWCFVIDPIDGTTNFIHDFRFYCISVAVFSHGEPIFGAIYNPYLKEYFHAGRGMGAYLGDRRITVSDTPLENALVAFGTSPYYRDTLADTTFSLLRELFMQTSDVRRCGSAALDLAYLAAGRVDAFFEMRLSPWDFAAGYVLITEAGGRISTLDGAPLDFSKKQPILASNATAFPALLALTSKYQNA